GPKPHHLRRALSGWPDARCGQREWNPGIVESGDGDAPRDPAGRLAGLSLRGDLTGWHAGDRREQRTGSDGDLGSPIARRSRHAARAWLILHQRGVYAGWKHDWRGQLERGNSCVDRALVETNRNGGGGTSSSGRRPHPAPLNPPPRYPPRHGTALRASGGIGLLAAGAALRLPCWLERPRRGVLRPSTSAGKIACFFVRTGDPVRRAPGMTATYVV